MKKIFLLLAIGCSAITANAQKVMESAVPAGVKTAFIAAHPTAVVSSWTKEPINNIRAEFIDAGVNTSVLMGPNNNILETVSEIKASDLPKGASASCAGKTILKSYKVTAYNGIVTFRVTADKDYNFDKVGNALVK